MHPRVFIAAAAWLLAGAAAAASDPLDRPARESARAEHGLITSIARAGDGAVVAVGQRGHALRSSDGGKTWQQGRVPLSSDLTAVQFVDARIGHAVGHDGVVLRSEDGGATWARLLDGRQANQIVVDHLRSKPNPDDTDRRLRKEAEANLQAGPDKPLLDLWFTSADEGFVVGAYNLILRTVDAGRTWQPWYDRTDNPKLLNLYAIRPAAGTLVIVGEGGLLLRLDKAAQRFVALPSPYKGSWFGVLALPPSGASDGGVLAFGMRGHAFASRDGGQHWSPVATGLAASITAGDVAPDGAVLLVDQAGGASRSRDGAQTFQRVVLPAATPLAAVAVLPGALVVGGPRGLRRVDLPKEP